MTENLSIFEMKLAAMAEALSDELILKAIAYPGVTDAAKWEELNGKAAFDYPKPSEIANLPATYLTFLVHAEEPENQKPGPWITQTLEITIYTRESHLSMTDAPDICLNRNDFIAQLLIEKFNGRTCLGLSGGIHSANLHSVNLLGRLTLISNTEGNNGAILYRKLVFSARDLSCISRESM